MKLISDEYRTLNTEKHSSHRKWGVGAADRWIPQITSLTEKYNSTNVLDYGCGKGTLGSKLPFIDGYDPNVPKFADLPEPHDIVVSFDVLEHVEPEFVDNVLDHIQHLTKKAAFLNICTRPASHTLPDGSNAHRTVRPAHWWREKISQRFIILSEDVIEGQGKKDKANFVLEPKL